MKINKEAFKRVLTRKIVEGAAAGIILSLLNVNIQYGIFFISYILIGMGLEVNNWKEEE